VADNGDHKIIYIDQFTLVPRTYNRYFFTTHFNIMPKRFRTRSAAQYILRNISGIYRFCV